MVLRGRRTNNFANFSLKACWAAMGIWVSSIIFYINDTTYPPQPQVWRIPKSNFKFHDSTQKNLCFRIIKLRLFYPPHYISNSSSQVDDFSGLIGSISHDDLYSLDYLNSLLELKNTKNASDLDTEWFSWPQPPGQPPFVGLIIENPILLWYLATSLLEAVEASLCHFYEI